MSIPVPAAAKTKMVHTVFRNMRIIFTLRIDLVVIKEVAPRRASQRDLPVRRVRNRMFLRIFLRCLPAHLGVPGTSRIMIISPLIMRKTEMISVGSCVSPKLPMNVMMAFATIDAAEAKKSDW